MYLVQGHNTVAPVGIEPRTSRFGVRRSTTTPPCFLFLGFKCLDLPGSIKKTLCSISQESDACVGKMSLRSAGSLSLKESGMSSRITMSRLWSRTSGVVMANV